MDSIKTCFVYVISLKLLSAILAVIFPVLGLLNYTSSYWILGFALPLTLMIWYLNKGRVVVKGLTIDNQVIFGNSCYYLGFLFTIATLIISLFMLGSEEFNVGTISLQFATAMITTLIGMCARIYYVTFSKYDNYKNGETIKTPNGVTLVIPPGKTLGNSSSQRNPSDNLSAGQSHLQQSLADLPLLGSAISSILGLLGKSHGEGKNNTESLATDNSSQEQDKNNRIEPIHIEEPPKRDDDFKQMNPVGDPFSPKNIQHIEPVETDPDEGIEVVIEAYCHNIAAMNSELINSINLYNQTNNVLMYTFGRLRSDLLNEIKDDREFKNAVKNFTKRVIEQHSAKSTEHLTNMLRLNHKESEQYIEEVKKRIDEIEHQSVERYKDLNKAFSNNCEQISEKMLEHFESSAANFLDKLQNITEKHVDSYIDFQNKTNDSLDHVVKTQLELEEKMASFNATQVKACEKTVKESIKKIAAVGNECQQEISEQLKQITTNADSYVSNLTNVIDAFVNQLHSASDIENLHNAINGVVSEIKEGAYSVQQIFNEFSNELNSSINESKISENLRDASNYISTSLNDYNSTVSAGIESLNSQLTESTELYKKQISAIKKLNNHIEEKISDYSNLIDKKIELMNLNVEQTESMQQKQLDSFDSLTEELNSNISNYKSAMEAGVNYFDNSLTVANSIHEKQLELSNMLKDLQDNLVKKSNEIQNYFENQLKTIAIKHETEVDSSSDDISKNDIVSEIEASPKAVDPE